MPTVISNGIKIYYEVSGSGKPLILLPGIGTDISQYQRIILPLSKGYKVIAIDTIGTGRSDMPDIPYSVEQMAEDVAEVMKHERITKASVLGVSIGGRIALAFALQHPSSVEKLVLVSSAARATKRTLWSHFLGFVSRFPLLESDYPQTAAAQDRLRVASREYDCLKQIHDISCPTIIAYGKFDSIVTPSLIREMHAHMRNSKLVSFYGGHLFFILTQRRAFLRTVEQFLNT
jgi:pimeloyl-ACP methyl ester carboxylesterase